MEHASPIASLALLLTVPLAIVLFSQLKPTRAVLVLVIGGLMYLPEVVRFDAPLVPPLTKHTLPMLCAVVGVLVCARNKLSKDRSERRWDWIVVALLFSAVTGTVLTNRDPVVYGPSEMVGYPVTDIPKMWLAELMGPLAAFLLGRNLFRTIEDGRDLLIGLAIGGLLYSPLIMFEWRMSPQLHIWIYGFFQHGFGQTKRNGGWRPVVFMENGLALAMFTFGTGLAWWVLARAKQKIVGIPPSVGGWLLAIVLFMSNSLGAFLYGVIAYPVVALLKPKRTMGLAVVLAIFTAVYPVLRANDLFPTQDLVDYSAAKAGQERAQSLWFRFMNEDRMIEKLWERPTFGWGGYARGHVINPETGKDMTVVDGAWIGILSARGFAGLAVIFGMLLVPLLVAAKRLKRIPPEGQPILAGLALMSAVFNLDLLPNGLFNLLPMFFAGSVLGLAQGMSSQPAHSAQLERVRDFLIALERQRQVQVLSVKRADAAGTSPVRGTHVG